MLFSSGVEDLEMFVLCVVSVGSAFSLGVVAITNTGVLTLYVAKHEVYAQETMVLTFGWY